MRQVSVGRRLLAAVFGFVLAIALSIYNAVNTTDTYMTPEITRAIFQDPRRASSYVNADSNVLSVLKTEIRDKLKDSGITERQFTRLENSQGVRSILEEVTVSLVRQMRGQKSEYVDDEAVIHLCNSKLSDIQSEVEGLDDAQRQAVREVYSSTVSRVAGAVFRALASRKVPFNVSLFTYIRGIALLVAAIAILLIWLIVKKDPSWLRTAGLVTLLVMVPILYTTIRLMNLTASATSQGASGVIEEAMLSINYLPLMLRTAAGVLAGAVMLIMGIKLKRAETSPGYATVPVVLQDFERHEEDF
ncbi:MAG: hypothetical protein II414_03815 [Erysipelotrichaceae bacterium]|nr:hypothetical protein [Erysipelotrichaceae bacterium]